MFNRLLGLLPFLLFFTLLPSAISSPMRAETHLARTDAAILAQGGGIGPPPLPANCGPSIVPTDYDLPVSCVNSYVYLNGNPVVDATLSISNNEESITAQTADNGSASEQPYFTVSLSNDPLNVQPGQKVTITAEVDGQSKTQTFIAQPGGQQIDVVLAQNRVEAAWQRVDLGARYGHAMAYDAARERVVLFGGRGQNTLDDTWEWDGNTWRQRLPLVSPSPRFDHAMAYDPTRERVVLFGANRLSDDMWEWNGETWIEQTPPVSPPKRFNHAMAYDAAGERIVLFGGFDGLNTLGDTWEWDGMTWQQQEPLLSPPRLADHAIAYDQRRAKMVLFGGAWDLWLQPYGEDDTWEWDGSTWRQLLPLISPPVRYAHAMAYDAARERIVLFGGRDGNYLSDTWEWDGSAWIELNPPLSPPARAYHEMVYDAGRERIVLFGGSGPDGNTYTHWGDTWEWDGNEWSLRATTEQPALRRLGALSYESNGQSLLFGGQNDESWFADTYRWTGSRWQQLTPANTPPERINHRLARNADGSQLLLFGGEGSDGGYRDDTWLWNGQDWLSQSPSTLPSARGEYGLTYDEEAGVWLLFGGRNETQYLGETWQYDGTNWVLRQPTTSPLARGGATLSYDAARGRAVLIGGRNFQGYLDEIWEWDGTDWVEVTPNGPNGTGPTARSGHQAAYDRIRQVVVMAGGQDTNGRLNDMWEWNGSFWRQRITNPSLPPNTDFAMTYDAEHDRLVALAGQGTYLHEVLGSPHSDAHQLFFPLIVQ